KQMHYAPLSEDVMFIACMRDRAQLYERIDERVDIMIAQGLIDEVRNLQNTDWETFLFQKKMIGYDDVLHYLHGSMTQQEAIGRIKKRSRNYAKRQITFLKKMYKDLKRDASTDLLFYYLFL